MATATRTPKDERLDIRLTGEHRGLLQQAADRRGQSLSDFVRAAALDKAAELARDSRTTVLSDRDRDLFLGELADDSEPSEALLDTVRHHRSTVG